MEALQRVARFVWVPFVARLLLEGHLASGPHSELPPDEPEALTSDTVADVREIIRRAVWAYLVRHGGWRRTRFVDPRADRAGEGRLWQAPHLEPPAFSSDSIRLLLLLFNATRRPPAQTGKAITPITGPRLQPEDDLPLDLSKSGDVLLHHIVFRRLCEAIPGVQQRAYLKDDWTARFAINPLNLLSHPRHFDVEPAAARERLARLLEDDLHPFLPWLARDWVGEWSPGEPGDLLIGDGLPVRRQQRIWKTWTRLLVRAERHDLLVPWIAFWARLDPDAELQDFEGLIRGGDYRLEDRAALAHPWVELLELGTGLHEVAGRVRALHPIDREAGHQLFLTACSEYDFDDAGARIERLIQGLRPTLG